MESICSDGPRLWSSDSVTDARSLQLAITTTDFICSLVITNSCLHYLQALTSNLQAESKDIVTAVGEIKNVLSTLQNIRDNISTHHSCWFRTVQKICADMGVEPSIPRRCARQTHRSNIPADTPSEYYCRTLSIPLLDHLLCEMNTRFSSHQQTALLGLSVVPSIMVALPSDEYFGKVGKFANMYEEDLPSPGCITSELHCWQLKWKQHLQEHGQRSLPSTPIATLTHLTSMYPNLLCTLPITSCSAERSFSGLKRIKSILRSSMTTERLTGLSLLHLHHDIPIDIEAAIDEFCRRHPRRLKMANILSD